MRQYLLMAVVGISIFTAALAAEPLPGQDLPPTGLSLTTPGIPDHVTGTLRAVNERMSQDLAPADNAAVDLLQLFGGDALDPALKEDTLRMMGIAALAPAATRFLFLQDFVKSREGISPEEMARQTVILDSQFIAANETHWKREQHPLLFKYLEENRAGLDRLVAASQKPRYYAPLLSEDEPPRLFSVALTIERRLPYLARCLAASALLRAGTGDIDGAILELNAGHRLAKLLAEGSPFDVSAAKAHIMDSVISRAAAGLLESGLLTGDQARLYLRELAAIGPLPESAIQADIGERAILRQEIELLQNDKSALLELFELADQKADRPADTPAPKIDWTIVFQRADEIQDQVVRALQTDARSEQEPLFAELDREYEAWNASVDALARKFADPEQQDVKVVSLWIGENMARSLRPWYRQRHMSDNRMRIRREMLVTGLKLAAYRGDHGEFPASLANLAPSEPADATPDCPITYVRENPHLVRLISLGGNGIDDAGSAFNDDQTLTIR